MKKGIKIEDKNYIIYNRDIYKRYKNTCYYVNLNGDIFSTYCNRIIKPLLRGKGDKKYYYIDIFDNKKGKQIHIPIHKIVYVAWVDNIENGQQINHKDDNERNNCLQNLYVGNQKENIEDCLKNSHKVGNVFVLKILDKKLNSEIEFCPANKFIDYSGHTNKSKSLKKFFDKKWFKDRYEILEYKKINCLEEYQSVTTMGDECNPVE